MEKTELLARLNNHEDNFVERKPEGVNASEIRKAIVAFANSVVGDAEGILFIGIHDNGTIQGVKNPNQLQKSVRDQCERACYPPIQFSSQVVQVGDKVIVAITIPVSRNKPHFSGPAYIRRGSESVTATPRLFEELIASRNDDVSLDCYYPHLLSPQFKQVKHPSIIMLALVLHFLQSWAPLGKPSSFISSPVLACLARYSDFFSATSFS